MSAQDQYLVGAAESARVARDTASKGTAGASVASALRMGIVTVAADGVYTVDVVGANGVASSTVAGVTAWGGSFAVSDRVMLAYVGDRPIPFIVAGGGGGAIEALFVSGPVYFTQ
jgi:hypothetical protein